MKATVLGSLLLLLMVAVLPSMIMPVTFSAAAPGAGPVGLTPSGEPPTPSATPTGTPTPRPIPVSLTLALQRPNSPPPALPWSVPVHVTLHQTGDATRALYAWDITLDQNGRWAGPLSIAKGIYDVRVRNLHTLRNVKRNVVVNDSLTINLGTLREGDANADNTINILDFARLRSAYFTERGTTGFDPTADFDENATVNILDFALLRGNYFAEGDIEVAESPRAAGLSATRSVSVTLLPPMQLLHIGEVRPCIVQVDATEQPLAGLDIELLYRPDIIAITDAAGLPVSALTPGSRFAVVLQNEVDAAAGQILFSAANFDQATSGVIEVASFYLRGVRPGASDIRYGARTLGADDSGRQVPFVISQPTVEVLPHFLYLPMTVRH